MKKQRNVHVRSIQIYCLCDWIKVVPYRTNSQKMVNIRASTGNREEVCLLVAERPSNRLVYLRDGQRRRKSM